MSSPNGGENWTAGSTYNVTWSISGSTSSINYQLVALSTDGGSTYNNIGTTQTPTSRSMSWTIPSGTSSTQARVRVRALDVNANILAQDASDANFTISASVVNPTVTVSSPNGGENWTAGSTYNVTWSISGSTSSINYQLVALSTDGGSTYNNIGTTQTPTSRSMSWTIPSGTSSTQARIRVRALDVNANILAQDASDANFTISASGQSPTITLTSPNGGESWTAGTTRTVSWTVSGTPASPISYFGMNYSLDSGTTWHLYGYFAAGSASSGTWTVPSTAVSSHARIQIVAVNSSGLAMFWGQSAGDITISSPSGNPTSLPTCNNRAPSPGSTVTINFNGSASTGSSPSCGIVSWLWTFDDGTTSSAENPPHTFYPPAGSATTYNVNLTVTDCGGKQASASLSVYITGLALGNNPTQPTSKDPVNLATGNYIYNHVDLKIPGRGLPFEFQRYYNSKDTASTGLPLGFGWTDSYNIQLSASDNAVVIAFGDGHQEIYAADGAGGYTSQPGIYNALTANGGAYTLTTKEQQKYNFNSQGQLTSISDKNNNTVTVAYSGNNLTTITDTVGRVISLAYNANNCLTNITDPLGRTVRFAYDAKTNLISVTDTHGGLTQFSYDQYHQLTNAIDPRGNTFVSMVYDDQQRVVSSQKDALQGATTFSYDFVNNVTTVTDAMKNVSYTYYDNQLRVQKAVDNLGNVESFQYDANNNRTMVVDKNGAVTSYAYDSNGNVIAKTNSFVQTTTIAYDALNNPTNRLDALTGRTLFRYDSNGNLTNTFNSLGKTNTYQYDAFGEPVIVTDANGNSSTNTYDSFGNLINSRDALGSTNAFTYDAVGRKMKQVDALGRTNLFIYDNADNLTASVNALGKTNYFAFDGNNNRVTVTDFNGNTTTNVYDAKDRLIIIRDPMGGSITNDYDALDRKIHVWDAIGNVTRYGYDADGNLMAVTNAVGAVTLYAYDPNGNRTNSIDPLGHSTTNVFDSLNRLVSRQDALVHTTISVYDTLGRRIQGIDALNRTNFFAYDSMGRLTNFTDTAGGTVRYTYDNVGNRTSVIDPNGHANTSAFDALNRLFKTTDPDGGVTQLGYDALGNLISRKDANGNTTTYIYDANNRRTKIIYPTGAPVTFGYDANGNRTSMTDSLGTTIYAYDALNRLTRVTDCYGQIVSYGYDKNGNRTSMTYPGNKIVHCNYDAINRLKTVTDWLGSESTYAYDANGNLASSVNANRTAAIYQYDSANRLIALTNSSPNSTVISSYAYTLDAVGNQTQVSQTEQRPTIPNVGDSAYAYDIDNRMMNSEGEAQSFDADGDMISIEGTNTLSYDYENRLAHTVFGSDISTYQYDGVGNRLSATRDGTVTRYVLDRNSPLSQVLADTDSSGNIIYYYIYGLGLISRIDPSGNVQCFHYDSRGSAVALTDSTGQIKEAYAYDPFGRPLNNPISDNRFRYLGRHGVTDEENGFLYIRARYYSTRRGRFITKDPTTGKDGDSQSMNRYIYALNNPVRLIDISGLSAQEASSPAPLLATSDSSLLHNILVSPTTGGLAPQGLGSESFSSDALTVVAANLVAAGRQALWDTALTRYVQINALDLTEQFSISIPQLVSISEEVIPVGGLLLSGVADAITTKLQNPGISNLQLGADVSENIGVGAAVEAISTAIGGPIGFGVGFGLNVLFTPETAYSP
ncbi:MAG: DUF6531 domain-containing protein [Limisphaerales bacterium]